MHYSLRRNHASAKVHSLPFLSIPLENPPSGEEREEGCLPASSSLHKLQRLGFGLVFYIFSTPRYLNKKKSCCSNFVHRQRQGQGVLSPFHLSHFCHLINRGKEGEKGPWRVTPAVGLLVQLPPPPLLLLTQRKWSDRRHFGS